MTVSGFLRSTKNSPGTYFLALGLLFIGTQPRPAVGEVLDLNTASAAELEALPGLGRRRAGLIVRVRRQNGPFRSISELRGLAAIYVEDDRSTATFP